MRKKMNMQIRPLSHDDMEEVVQLSLLAWVPVFHSFEQVLGAKIYSLLFPDWQETQRATVEKICREHEKTLVWVAEAQGTITGFIAYTLKQSRRWSREHGRSGIACRAS
jgi:predicted N-acetyltransferase YhbS